MSICVAEGSVSSVFKKMKEEFPMTKIEKENKKLLETAISLANGYYIIEEEAHKIKTFEQIDGKMQPIEKIEIVPIKKYVPPNASVNTFLIKSRISGYGDDQPDTQIEVLIDDEVKKYSK